jgi:hypothetical protein
MSAENNPPSAARKFDAMSILKAIWLPFLSWTVAVLVVSFGGKQPGVVCATPMAWFLALWVGLRSAAYTRSEIKGVRLMEAALAERHLRFAPGSALHCYRPFHRRDQNKRTAKGGRLALVMLALGAVISAIPSVAIAASQERRRGE